MYNIFSRENRRSNWEEYFLDGGFDTIASIIANIRRTYERHEELHDTSKIQFEWEQTVEPGEVETNRRVFEYETNRNDGLLAHSHSRGSSAINHPLTADIPPVVSDYRVVSEILAYQNLNLQTSDYYQIDYLLKVEFYVPGRSFEVKQYIGICIDVLRNLFRLVLTVGSDKYNWQDVDYYLSLVVRETRNIRRGQEADLVDPALEASPAA